MKKLFWALFITVHVVLTFAAETNNTAAKPIEPTVFRQPFTLKLHVDDENYYEEEFDKMPFVHKNDVYLFKGDEFGLLLNIRDKPIHDVSYQPDIKKSDVTLKFTQEVKTNGSMMILVIHNNTDKEIFVDALMTVPGKKTIAKTTILPIGAGLSNYESWPHPIVQLVLRNIRTEK